MIQKVIYKLLKSSVFIMFYKGNAHLVIDGCFYLKMFECKFELFLKFFT